MKDFILSILKKLTKNQLITLVMILGTAFGGKLYIDNKSPEVKPVDNTLQIELKTLSSEFYRFKKYEIEEISLLKRFHEIEINNLQKEFDAKVLLLADNLQANESKRVKDMLEFAESVKPNTTIESAILAASTGDTIEPQKTIEHPIPTNIVELYTDEINVAHNADTLSIKDSLIKKSFLKRVFGIFKRDTLK